VTRSYTQDTIIIGIIIGEEGVMALRVPLIAGPWSDQLRSRIGGRLAFVIAGAVPAAIGLLLVGILHSLLAVALAAGLFFAFYFVAYEPYRAMYPDLVESTDVAGRAQSAQAVARGLGTGLGLALIGSGLLLTVDRAAPFVFAAVFLLAATGAFVYLVLSQGLAEEQKDTSAAGPREVARQLVGLLSDHPALRTYFMANASGRWLWPR
jgi:Na+/melibiose symporter-like transporter